jgi:hypothetical protein
MRFQVAVQGYGIEVVDTHLKGVETYFATGNPAADMRDAEARCALLNGPDVPAEVDRLSAHIEYVLNDLEGSRSDLMEDMATRLIHLSAQIRGRMAASDEAKFYYPLADLYFPEAE